MMKRSCLAFPEFPMKKNIQAVLAAFAEVLKEEDKVKLVVAGDGLYLDDLKRASPETRDSRLCCLLQG